MTAYFVRKSPSDAWHRIDFQYFILFLVALENRPNDFEGASLAEYNSTPGARHPITRKWSDTGDNPQHPK